MLGTILFWAPLLEQKNATQYEVFVPGRMTDNIESRESQLELNQLFLTKPQETMSFELGICTVLGLLFTPLVIKKIDKRYKKIYMIFLGLGLTCLIFTLKIFPFEQLPEMARLIQFAWRMLEFCAFFFGFVTAVNFYYVMGEMKMTKVWIITGLVIISLLPQMRLLESEPKGYPEVFLKRGIPVTGTTKRVHAGCASFEYLPSKAFQNKQYIIERTQDVYILEGEAMVYNQEKTGSSMEFDFDLESQTAILEFPYIYYKGYEVKVSTPEGKEKQYIPEESENGFVQLKLEQPLEQQTHVKIEYTGTTIIKVTKYISFLTWLLLIYYCYHRYRLTKKKK